MLQCACPCWFGCAPRVLDRLLLFRGVKVFKEAAARGDAKRGMGGGGGGGGWGLLLKLLTRELPEVPVAGESPL